MISLFGVKGVAVEEVYAMDSVNSATEDEVPIETFGYVFLFKWKKELQNDGRIPLDAFQFPNLFFARQIATNACASQAILAVLLNSPGITLDQELQEFKDFTISLDPESRGIAIGGLDKIRLAHNSFTRPDPFLVDNGPVHSKDAEDPYHFVAYLPFEGRVLEIDGLKSGPLGIGEYDVSQPRSWHAVAQPAIEARMAQFGAAETHFALLRICQKRSVVLQGLINQSAASVGAGQELMAVEGQDAGSEADANIRHQLERYNELLQVELLKEKEQAAENIRRRHNYVPFIVEMLHSLSRAGKLRELIDTGVTKAQSQSLSSAAAEYAE